MPSYCVKRTKKALKILQSVSKFKPGTTRARGINLYVIDQSDVKRIRAAGYKLGNKKQYSKEVNVYEISTKTILKPAEVKSKYINLCNARIKKAYAEKQKELDNLLPRLETLQHETIELMREIDLLRQQTRSSKEASKESRKRLGEEFDKLASLPKVESVSIEGDRLDVHTTVIYCRNPETKKFHRLGRFRISLNCKTHKIGFKNKSGTQMGHHAPHITTVWGGCRGTAFHKMATELFGKYEYCGLVLLCIQFLESVNIHDSWGQKICYWPVVKGVPKNASQKA